MDRMEMAWMSLKEIQKNYPQEWVLVEHKDLDENLQISKGQVLAHSSNKEDIYKALGQTKGKNVSIEYTGPVDKDLTVMSFLV